MNPYKNKYNRELWDEYDAQREEIIALKKENRELKKELERCMAMHEITSCSTEGGPWFEQYRKAN